MQHVQQDVFTAIGGSAGGSVEGYLKLVVLMGFQNSGKTT